MMKVTLPAKLSIHKHEIRKACKAKIIKISNKTKSLIQKFKVKKNTFKHIFSGKPQKKWKEEGTPPPLPQRPPIKTKKSPISVQDIQDSNKKTFSLLSENSNLKVFFHTDISKINFVSNAQNSSTIRGQHTLSFQTSSIYLSEVEVRPKSYILKTKDKKYNALLQTINQLLQETEHIYNEICPNLVNLDCNNVSNEQEVDPFDNLSLLLENTIWEDKIPEPPILLYFNPDLFKDGLETNLDVNPDYCYMEELLSLYKRDSLKPAILNLSSYQVSSGSTLVLNG